jgi:hypothetical protein
VAIFQTVLLLHNTVQNSTKTGEKNFYTKEDLLQSAFITYDCTIFIDNTAENILSHTCQLRRGTAFEVSIGTLMMVNCGMKKSSFQVRNEFSLLTSKLLHNYQFKKRRRSNTLKGSQRMGGQVDFTKSLPPSHLNDDLSIEPNFGRIHLAGPSAALSY